METTPNSYDELPYPTLPIAETNPLRLSFASFLHGGPRPSVARFRMLELGCGNGRNLLPLAFHHPGSEFVGVDGSAAAIARARAGAEAIGARNLRFEVADLADPGLLRGERFEYVVLHGVFSWVEARIRDAILALCSDCTSPDGLVYLSHNVWAGWRVRSLVRELLMSSVAGIFPLRERVRRAQELAKQLGQAISPAEHAQQVQLAWELERVSQRDPSYVFHEYLLPVNQPFHHREVADLLRARGFAYSCDTKYREAGGREPEGLSGALDELGVSGETRQEYVDFLGCRTFRCSVFAREEAAGAADAERVIAELDTMFAVGDLARDADSDAKFTSENGSSVAVTSSLLQATLAAIAETRAQPWPIGALLATARSRVAEQTRGAPIAESDLTQLRRDLLALHEQGLVEVLPALPRAMAAPRGRRPHALARYEAELGDDLTTPLHTSLRLRDADLDRLRRLGRCEPLKHDPAAHAFQAMLAASGLLEEAADREIGDST